MTDTGGLSGPRDSKLCARLDEICDRFESAWQAGPRPDLQDFLGQVELAVQPHLLRQLLLAEWDLHRHTNESVDVDRYVARFPQYDSVVHAAYNEWQAEKLSEGRAGPDSASTA